MAVIDPALQGVAVSGMDIDDPVLLVMVDGSVWGF